MGRRRHLALVAAAALAAVSAPAVAQTSRPPQIRREAPEDPAGAVHLDAATTAFGERRYDVAAREFEIAWELTHNPLLLFNAGSAWDRVPDTERALSAYRRFLEHAPVGPNSADVRARVAVLERMRPPPIAAAPSPAPVARPAAPLVASPPPPAVSPSPGGAPWRIVAIASAGAAALFGGVAAAVYASASSDYDRLQGSCAPRCAPADAADIDTRATVTNALLGAAGTALALSVVSLALDLTSSRGRGPDVRVSAALSPDGARAGVGVTF
jgi:hypothetical protein